MERTHPTGRARRREAPRAVRLVVTLLSGIAGALANAFLIPLPWIGAIMWLGLAVHSLRYAAFGLLGVAVGNAVGRALDVRDKPALGGGVGANALLAAISVAWLTRAATAPAAVEIVLAVLAAAAAAVLAAALMRVLAATVLPALVLAFALVAGTLFLVFPVWSAGAVAVTRPWPAVDSLDAWVQTFIRSLGSLLFSSTVGTGLLVGAALLLWSRATFLAGAAGWLAGALVATGLQQLHVPFYWQPASYNFFIAGMALGAVFFLPGWSSLGFAAFGGGAAAIIALLLQRVAPDWAFVPVSAVLATWVGLAAFTLTDSRFLVRRNQRQDIRPEEAWLHETSWTRRFGDREPLLIVPVAGPCTIAQGFDGGLSHAGPWRHAIDFQRPPQPGPDASIWETPVGAPAAGTVARVRDGVADNPIGVANYAENWGNYVLIHLDQGGYALLAHLRRNSIGVGPGMRVEIGAYVGLVGNSGRSPVPHLHMQAQRSPVPGAPTVPFRLANFQSAARADEPLDRWNAAAVPAEGTAVAACWPNPPVHDLLASLAPGTALWTVEVQGRIPRPFRPRRVNGAPIRIAIHLDEAGQYLFTAGREATLVAVLDPDAWRVRHVQGRVSPLLELLALAAPSIPYAARCDLFWNDPAPVTPRLTRAPALSLGPYTGHALTELRVVCTGEPGSRTGSLTLKVFPTHPKPSLPLRITCEFEPIRGPVRIEAGFRTGSLVYSQLSFDPGLPLASIAS